MHMTRLLTLGIDAVCDHCGDEEDKALRKGEVCLEKARAVEAFLIGDLFRDAHRRRRRLK